MSTILITGSSGAVGKLLIPALITEGHTVKSLTTNTQSSNQKDTFIWNLKTGFIENGALDKVDTIVHLAGVNIGKGFWTKKNKSEIIHSRVDGLQLLLSKIKQEKLPISKLISMSGTSYYDNISEAQTEDSPLGKGFLSEVCLQWENAALEFEKIGIPTTILRTAPVLMPNAGLLPAYLLTAGIRIIPTLGSPNNSISWIHAQDLVKYIVQSCNANSIKGIYNLSAPNAATQKEFVLALDAALGKKSIHPNVPAWALKIALGEKSILPLCKQKILPTKLKQLGFTFDYPDVNSAVLQILKG
jgi:uncharacterized protein